MSTRKRPLAELPQAHTPTRYAPSTPHAIRALQERSGAKTRSVRRRQLFTETVRPDSARGILKRFAKITAPTTRRITRTPVVLDNKENEQEQDEDGENAYSLKKPRMTFDIEESIEEDDQAPEYEEEDSELPTAPTPSILPDDDNNPTLTFKSIDFAQNTRSMSEKADRRKSRVSFAETDEPQIDEDNDPTILSERGRRAVSEDLTRRLSRYSFGSIRMSDFGSQLEVRRGSDGEKGTKMVVPSGEDNFMGVEAEESLLEGETENLRLLRRSLSDREDNSTAQIPAMDESFQLEMPEDDDFGLVTARQDGQVEAIQPTNNEADWEEDEGDNSLRAETPEVTRQLTQLETLATKPAATSRKRKLKMTKHGTLVPALASSLVKRVAVEAQIRRGSRKPVLGKEHVKALEQATEWFFEQVSEDLAAYAAHGRRKKTIDTSDVLMLMQRQRLPNKNRNLQQLAKDWIPPDVMAELDLP